LCRGKFSVVMENKPVHFRCQTLDIHAILTSSFAFEHDSAK